MYDFKGFVFLYPFNDIFFLLIAKAIVNVRKISTLI